MATVPFDSDVDLQLNQLLNGRLQMLSSAPDPLEARIYYDTTLHKFGYYNGTKWVYDTELTSANIIAGLGYTPYNATNPDGFITSAAVGDGVITFQKNGTQIGTISANQSGTSTINITVPTQASDIGALSDNTTINDLTTPAQQAALNSGATSEKITQIGTNQTNITNIQGLIPSQASSSNQLADKDFVNSSISTNTADFDGSWATYAAIPSTVAGFTTAGFPEPTNNNYLVVKEDETQDGGTWRYKYVDAGGAYAKANWKVEYEVNETPFTAAQLAAINSGVDSTLVAQIRTNESDISAIQTTLGTYGDIVTHNASEFTRKVTVTNPALTVSGGVATWNITNSLATADVNVLVYRVADGVQVMTEVDLSSSAIVIRFNSTSNITAGRYKAVIIG